MHKRSCNFTAVALLTILCDGTNGQTSTSVGPSLIGIDHVPTVVSSLEEASDTYRHFGFSIKPGRFHENGLRNSHIKFKDGSGIELISPPVPPTDELTTSYSKLLQQGAGPAYISFHAREMDKLTLALHTANISFTADDGLITLDDPHLNFVFFVRDNRSPTDKPEHFVHSNGSVAMTEVWLAMDAPTFESLRKLLLSLGSVERTQTIAAPHRTPAHVFYVQNGRVIALPENRQLIPRRNIVGVTFCTLKSNDTTVAPSPSHNLWLHFRTQPCL